MQDVPEHDPDSPRVALSGAGPVRSWLEAAARSLAVRAEFNALTPPAESVHGEALAVLAARSTHGQVVVYAAAREIWRGDELVEVVVDVTRDHTETHRAAIDIMTRHAVVGAACVRTLGGRIALDTVPGPQLNGAWTLDGAATSIYENHIRALLDLPLGSPRIRDRAVVCCRVGAAPGMHAALRHCYARDPELRVHLYGTNAPTGMTIGHVTVVASNSEDALRRARHAAEYLTGTIEE